MGLLDWINRAQEKMNDLQKRIESYSTDRPVIQREKNQKSASPRQSKIAKKILRRFYAGYPETPYISNDRKENWIERAELFPKHCIIPKTMLTRFPDGLLPGHVYMLYWLKKHTNKKVPSYFEYRYGIDFEKEKDYLYEYKYLDDRNKPTDKGEEAIKNHYDVIELHAAATDKPDCSIEIVRSQILAQRDSLIRNGFKRYEFIANSDCCDVCRKLNGRHFSVSKLETGVNAPPMHEGCRCSISAYSDRQEYEDWLNSF